MLKYILAFLLLLAVWAAALFFDLTLWLPIGVTVLVLAALVAVWVVRRIKARRAARDLEKALVEQGAQHAAGASPALQAELAQVQAEFDKAVAALKSSKLGAGGKDALYQLPWHIIIGPPGAGKTTALRNSGIQFPYLSKDGGGVRGIGGTRNCDWWLTNEAVLIDTAGRWSTQEQDRDEWFGFLDLLKRYRPKQPLNGILVAVSVSELGGATEQEAIALGARIRDRVDEAMNRLQMSLPVYLVFTKCDLMPGFVETFADLTSEERAQIWGFTLPTQERFDPGDKFSEKYGELVSALEERSLARMSEERRIPARHQVFGLPQQLAALEPNMRGFVSKLFEENVFRDTPSMRGVYFASGTQEGRPIDRVMSRMAEAFGLKTAQAAATPTESKSYFLRDVFQRVVFKDTLLAARSEGEQTRQKQLRYLTAGVLLLTSLCLFVAPLIGFLANRSFVEETASVAAAARAVDSGDDPLAPNALHALNAQMATLASYEEDGAPFSMRFGQYQAAALYEPMRAFRARLIRDRIVRPIFAGELRSMDEFGRQFEALQNSAPTSEQHVQQYDILRSHLLLTVPRGANEPALEGEVATSLVDAVAGSWARALEVPDTGETSTQMREQLGGFVAEMAAHDELAFRRDAAAVRRSRDALSRVSQVQLAVDGIVRRFEGEGGDISVQSIVGRTVPSLVGRRIVRAAFTRRIWEDYVKELLTTPTDRLLGEAWVLGEVRRRQDSDEAQEARRASVRAQYFERYIDEWREFIRGLRVRPPEGNTQALTELQDLTRGEPSALKRIFQQIAYNADLRPPREEPSAAADAAETGVVAAIERRLQASPTGSTALRVARGAMSDSAGGPTAPEGTTEDDVYQAMEGYFRFGVPPAAAEGETPQSTALDVYLEQLLFVRDALQTHLEDPSEPDALSTRLQTARTRTLGLISDQEVGWRPSFENILWPPIDGASMSFTQAIATGAGRSWCSEVAAEYRAQLQGRYPFNPSGHDVAIQDFAAFFKPEDGTLWGFYGDRLDTRIARNGATFDFSTQLGRPASHVHVTALLRYLERAHETTQVFFPPGATDPQVDFDVRIRPAEGVASQVLRVGGAEVEYRNEPEQWTRMSWPGTEPAVGAVIEVRGEGGMHELVSQEGEWGLFRLIEAGTVTNRGSDRVFTVVWHLRTHDVDITMDIRPTRNAAPFFGTRGSRTMLEMLRHSEARLPPEIVTAQRVCREP
ncbi:MAG: type VI secretion system membrane subunit TssM [Myxococcales bacterium]|nr:type VI secretion system membrane subunit TssM [Myxococcales bacterium]